MIRFHPSKWIIKNLKRRRIVLITVMMSIGLLVVRDNQLLPPLYPTRVVSTILLAPLDNNTPRMLKESSSPPPPPPPPLPNKVEIKAPQHGDVFVPGSLSLTRLETYHKCYMDPCKYRHHFAGSTVCNTSPKYNLTYYMIGKAASSSCRHIMTNSFEGKENKCDITSMRTTKDRYSNSSDPMLHFTFFRDPYSRFLASYHEALLRSFVPKQKSPIPKKYYPSFKAPYENMRMKDFIRLFEATKGQEHLTASMQRFIMNYDAEIPFDRHLRLQVPRLANPQTGRTIQLDAVFDTETLEEDFQRLAAMVNAPSPETGVRVYERFANHKIDADPLTRDARRKICQLASIDYCCLNYKLPEECKGAVMCQWTSRPEYPGELLIETLSQYPPPIENADTGMCIKERNNLNRRRGGKNKDVLPR